MSLSNTDAVVLIPRTSYVTVDGDNVFKEVIIVEWFYSVYSMSIQMVSLQEREPWDVNVHTLRKDHMNTEIRGLPTA